MSSDTYEILALAARYWFIALAALIVFRGWRASIKDNRSARILRDWDGGAGCVGELVVLEDGIRSRKRSMKGERFRVPMEGLVGSGSTADIRIRHADIHRKHIWMTYSPGCMTLNLIDKAQAETPVLPDGKRILRDGDQLIIGRLRMEMVFHNVDEAAAAQPVYVKKNRTARRRQYDEFDDQYEEKFWE